ncbi:MAG: uroporphyrinogen decarboxylase family protein [Planctomycetota bacterium]
MGDKIFETDRMTRRERVEATLNHQSVDRAAIHEQLSYNAGVIELYTGKTIKGFDYGLDDICAVIGQTLDMCFPPGAPCGRERVTDADGFVFQHDYWTAWRVSRPFCDAEGARDWLLTRTDRLRETPITSGVSLPGQEGRRSGGGQDVRDDYRRAVLDIQSKIDGAVLCNFSMTGFCGVFDAMGLELFTYFSMDYPDVLADYMRLSTEHELARVHAVADVELSPVILIPEDFSTKQGPIFPPEFLWEHHYPYVKKLTEAWHEHGIKVIYHSDGNYKKAIPELITCGVDGFYCLEPACGMDIVELKRAYPDMVWAGGIDGVDLMERGTPEQVRAEVHRHIRESNVLAEGGMFIATSAEINPPVKPENFRAMVEAAGELTNASFAE